MADNLLKKRHGLLLTLIVTSLLWVNIIACSLPKPYVGEKYNTLFWCHCTDYPKDCVQKTEYFVYEYTVSEGETGDEYIIQGTMDGSGGSVKSWSSIVHNESQFRILLANDSVVVDNIPFRPMGDRLTGKIPFKTNFTCQAINNPTPF